VLVVVLVLAPSALAAMIANPGRRKCSVSQGARASARFTVNFASLANHFVAPNGVSVEAA
ncbi:MAG TPA: hypothetical protein VF988_08245, partial [Verrucomicrobiae bacterium]